MQAKVLRAATCLFFLPIGRCAGPFARAGGEVGPTAADTARRPYRRSPSSRAIATAAAITPHAHRVITRTRCAEQGAGSNKRLSRRARLSSSTDHGGKAGAGRAWRRSLQGRRSSFAQRLAAHRLTGRSGRGCVRDRTASPTGAEIARRALGRSRERLSSRCDGQGFPRCRRLRRREGIARSSICLPSSPAGCYDSTRCRNSACDRRPVRAIPRHILNLAM